MKHKDKHKLTLDELEALETADWIADCEKREWEKSEDYAKRKALAENFAKRKSS